MRWGFGGEWRIFCENVFGGFYSNESSRTDGDLVHFPEGNRSNGRLIRPTGHSPQGTKIYEGGGDMAAGHGHAGFALRGKIDDKSPL